MEFVKWHDCEKFMGMAVGVRGRVLQRSDLTMEVLGMWSYTGTKPLVSGVRNSKLNNF